MLTFINNAKQAAGSTFVLLAALVFQSCIHNTQKELEAVEELGERPSLSMKDVHSQVTDSGFCKYEFETPELMQFDDVEEPYVYFPNGLKFKMFGEKGTVTKSRIRCNNAKYYKDNAVWKLNNDVEAITEKNETLNTEQLFWDTKEHRVYSEKFVKITTRSQVITGMGFESDEKLSKYEIKHPGGEIEVDND